VRGLFTRSEQDTVLATFEKSVVYVTSETIEAILLNERWDRSACCPHRWNERRDDVLRDRCGMSEHV